MSDIFGSTERFVGVRKLIPTYLVAYTQGIRVNINGNSEMKILV